MASSASRLPLSGVLLVLLGTLFFAEQLHWITAGRVIAQWWPAVLVIAGLLQIAERRSVFGGVILCAMGLAFLLGNLHLFNLHQLGHYWPLLIVALGLQIVLSARGK